MGLPVLIYLCEPQVSADVIDAAMIWLHQVDRRFSTYSHDSEISRLNRGELTRSALHPDVRLVLDRCEELREATDGYFDIRAPYLPDGHGPAAGRGAPGSIDPSGFVKGWAIGEVMRRLQEAGAMNLAVNGGGDVVVAGRPQDDNAWRVGIQHPQESDKIAITLAINQGAVATSGAYARGHHIMNPRTGRAAAGGLSSVTIIGPDLATADAYATTVYAMGLDRGAAFCSLLSGCDAVLIADDATVLTTSGVDAFRI